MRTEFLNTRHQTADYSNHRQRISKDFYRPKYPLSNILLSLSLWILALASCCRGRFIESEVCMMAGNVLCQSNSRGPYLLEPSGFWIDKYLALSWQRYCHDPGRSPWIELRPSRLLGRQLSVSAPVAARRQLSFGLYCAALTLSTQGHRKKKTVARVVGATSSEGVSISCWTWIARSLFI